VSNPLNGDAADVDDDAVTLRGMKHLMMECRHHRRALTAGGHVARAEIRHRGDAGAFGDHGRIADLEREGMRRARTVAQRLAVAADGADVLFRQP
jgi:hypothetical protein